MIINFLNYIKTATLRKLFLYLFISVGLLSCVSSKQLNVTSVQQSKDDIVLLQKILEANHPSLYWYTPKDSIDAAFSNTINSINDSLTHLELKNKIAAIVSQIKCGHTSVRFSKKYGKQLEKQRYPLFPLAIKVWDDSLVVLGSAYRNDSIFKRGTIITSINNKSPRQLLDSMFMYMSTDGNSINFKNQVVTYNFGNYYRNTFGLDSIYNIIYVDKNGNEQTASLKNFIPVKDTSIKKPQIPTEPVKKPTKREIKLAKIEAKRNVQMDTSLSSAYFSINTFNNAKHRKFYKKSFKEIKKRGIKNVVIDLRQNGGGDIFLATTLTKYLADSAFKIADTVVKNKGVKYSKHIKNAFFYKISLLFATHKKKDGKKHFGYFERHWFKPKKKNHFDGNVYILQGGYSFSASTLVIHALQNQRNVTLIGEETGGGSYGNNAVFLPEIILPNSGVRVGLPLFRLVMDKDAEKTGRGIMPDVNIPPSSVAIRGGYDAKIEYVKQLIKQQNSTTQK